MTPEQKLTKQVIDYLKKRRRMGESIWWLKLHGGPMQRAGIPDLIVLHNGRTFFIELKAGAYRETALQRETMTRIRAAGVRAEVARTLEQVEALLAK